MIKRITLFLLILYKFGLAQTVPEALLLGLGTAAADGFQRDLAPTKFHKGFIVTNSDTIKGQIRLGGKRIYFITDSMAKANKAKKPSMARKVTRFIFSPFLRKDFDKKYIKMKQASFVRVYAEDTLITRNGFMDFNHIGPSWLMYRKIYSGSIDIFDHTISTDENRGYIDDDLVVMDNGKIITSTYAITKKYLVNCINKKFNKDFKTSDFRRKIDVIYWLKLNDINSVE